LLENIEMAPRSRSERSCCNHGISSQSTGPTVRTLFLDKFFNLSGSNISLELGDPSLVKAL
jgi:hypothetical protein